MSDLEVEALSTAMVNKLKFEVYFHLVILDYALLYWLTGYYLLVLSLILTNCYTAFLHNGNLPTCSTKKSMRGMNGTLRN